MGASFLYSLLLHGAILLLLVVQLPGWITPPREKPKAVPIMIDLTKIDIADKTNLPPQAKEKSKPVSQQKIPSVQPKPKPMPPKVTPPRPPQKKTASVEPKKTPVPSTVKPKPVPNRSEKETVQPTPQPRQEEDTLDSLLASVEKMSKSMPTPVPDTPKETTDTLNGIKGGTGGDISQKLTISELDFIATAIRKNWNLDPGAKGIDTMVIEIRVFLDKSGTVYQVDILDKKRYGADKSFQSVADSAKRAIYISNGQGADSPFRKLANKRPETYGQWKEIVLRFNPMDGVVF